MRFKVFAILFIVGLNCFANAHEKLIANKEMSYLRQSFPDAIEESKVRNRISIGACPDGTCDAVNVPSSALNRDATDALYLYLLYFSTFVLLKDWKEKPETKKIGDEIVKRHTKGKMCSRKSGVEASKCIIRELAKKNDLKFEYIRYDEGGRNVMHWICLNL